MSRSSVILVSGGFDRKIRFWDASNGYCSRILRHVDSQINCLQISPEKDLILAGGNPRISLYDVNNRDDMPVQTFEGHTNNVTEVGFQKDSKWIYSCSEDGTVKIWDLRTPTSQRNYECHFPVNTVILHPNQAELLSGDQNGCIKTWDLNANSCRNEIVPVSEVAIRSLSMVEFPLYFIRQLILFC